MKLTEEGLRILKTLQDASASNNAWPENLLEELNKVGGLRFFKRELPPM